jgi:prevent-host-death family protein
MSKTVGSRRQSSDTRQDYWSLQDAKARFSELARAAKNKGPQHVTVHGRDEIVILSTEEFRRLRGERSGRELVGAMQNSPHREIELAPTRRKMPVRDVNL